MKKTIFILILVLFLIVACAPTEPTYSGNTQYIVLDPQAIVDNAVYVTREDGLQCLVGSGVWGVSSAQTMYVAMSCDWDHWEK